MDKINTNKWISLFIIYFYNDYLYNTLVTFMHSCKIQFNFVFQIVVKWFNNIL